MRNLDLALLGLARLSGLSLAAAARVPLRRLVRRLHTINRARKEA